MKISNSLKPIWSNGHRLLPALLLLGALAGMTFLPPQAAGARLNGLSPTTLWIDPFAGPGLDASWSWIREDPGHWSLTNRPGFMRITVQEGGLPGGSASMRNLLVQTAPAGDFEIQTRVLFEPTENFQIAGLLLYQDDDSFMVLGRAHCDIPQPVCVGNGIYFDFAEQGMVVPLNYATGTALSDEAYLRVVRQGDTYTGYYSPDGAAWTEIGAHTASGGFQPAQVGLAAGNGPPGAIGPDADFDYFLVYAGAGTRYVATTGDNGNANQCLDPANPCRTIQRAIDAAAPGQSILVAGGTYTENLQIGIPLTITGGFDSSTWDFDVQNRRSVIDGSANQSIPGAWDGAWVGKPAVIRDSNQFVMWYDGGDIFNQVRVGLATSASGTSWNKAASNPVLDGTPGAWDEEASERAPWVIKEGGVFKMWYESGEPRQLGYATSGDGIHWTKHPNPVLQGGPEPYDQGFAGHGSVLHEGDYKLWYHAIGDQGPIIAHATSPDGIQWSKQGPALVPEGGSWDEFALWGPSVLRTSGLYWMWYSGAGPLGPPSIGLATSPDGSNWTRVGAGPVLTEDFPIGDPHVILHGSLFKMWYSDYVAGAIRYAESADGINWTTFPGNPVVEPGELGQYGEPVVRFLGNSSGSRLERLDITGGHSDEAGGVHASDASIAIRHCRIYGNFGGIADGFGAGGVLGAFGGKTLAIHDSVILDNGTQSGAGGVRAHSGSLEMVNVLLAQNWGDFAIHGNGSVDLMNVTVADNAQGVLHNPPEERLLSIANSILWNDGQEIAEGEMSLVQVRHSAVQDGWFGAGNIDQNPLFMGSHALDYHLRMNSPCIDAGRNSGAPDHDMEGDGRPYDGDNDGEAVVDMGADEFWPRRIWLPVMLK